MHILHTLASTAGQSSRVTRALGAITQGSRVTHPMPMGRIRASVEAAPPTTPTEHVGKSHPGSFKVSNSIANGEDRDGISCTWS